ncbi:hypothetical protein ABT093_20315 [Kitasatospora sp. NPDC002551]|uniref:WD40 repeat domain-containing protein n=1 Tax=Kitasatospora sp. NPDC002551 TaxID=3154539 RepID=UPI00331F28EF
MREGGPPIVLGPSGAGKSSLLAAGVLPAVADGALAVADSIGTVTLWSLPPTLLVGGGPVAFSPDGRLLATTDGDTAVRLWSLTDPGRPVAVGSVRSEAPAPIRSLAFSPDGHSLAIGVRTTGGTGGAVRLVEVTDPGRPGAPTALGAPPPGDDAVVALAYRPDGHLLASAHESGAVHLWDLVDRGRPPHVVRAPSAPRNPVSSLAFDRDGTTLAVGLLMGVERHLIGVGADGPTSAPGPAVTGPPGPVAGLSFRPDGHALVAGGWESTTRIWDPGTRFDHVRRPPFPVATGFLTAAAFSPDGGTVAAGSGDGTVRLSSLDPATGSPVAHGRVLTGPSGAVASIAFSPTGDLLAVAGSDGTVRLWDLDIGAAISRICATSDGVLTRETWSELFGDTPYRRPCDR